MNFESFKRVSGEGKAELSKQGSKFVGICLPSSEDELESQLERLERGYSDATHLCYGAVLIVDDRAIERYHSDGEPPGTAGKPILQVIKGKEMYQTSVFVIRYFGGKELGTGGLVRAYGGAAKRAVQEAGSVIRRRRRELKVSYPYSLTGSVMEVLESGEGKVEVKEIEYGERPVARILVPLTKIDQVKNRLMEASSGRVDIGGLD